LNADFDKIKNILNASNEISLDQNNIYISAVVDSEIVIKNTINYSKILNDDSENAIEAKIVYDDTNSLSFRSKCNNKNAKKTIDNNINDNNNIESKLLKLKSLFDKDLITQEEYNEGRKKILESMFIDKKENSNNQITGVAALTCSDYLDGYKILDKDDKEDIILIYEQSIASFLTALNLSSITDLNTFKNLSQNNINLALFYVKNYCLNNRDDKVFIPILMYRNTLPDIPNN